jgi:4-amino-4-deoxy-L-arabinose transferase-like glycosyltransferase
MFWSRIPMILVLIFLGWFMFMWAKKLWGKKAGLIALFIFAFFPTFLAHGRLVTTDIGAATGALIATYFWVNFLKNPGKKSVIFAGLTFGIAMLIKFSLVLLIPFFAVITLVWAFTKQDKGRIKNLFKYAGMGVLAGLIGLIFVIWPVYQFHVANYPKEKQIQDTQALLNTTRVPESIIKINLLMEQNSFTRPIGQYLLGILTATNRTTTGNTTYFMGQVSADSWKTYFPVVYFIKNPLAFHILTLIALLYALFLIKRPWWKKPCLRITEWIKTHFSEFSMLVFLTIYWATSLFSNLNIGVRHLMPVFPFTILLVSGLTAKLLKEPFLKLKYAALGILFAWQAISVISIYPHFIAYFNEAIGGPDNGYKYVVDSNLDWGQDLKRLGDWIYKYNTCTDKPGVNYEVCTQKIDKIYLDYFGGGNADYYLAGKYLPWWGTKNPEELTPGSYLAVSVNQLQGGRAVQVKGYKGDTEFYNWLNKYEPIAKIGYSIFVYKIRTWPQ